MTTSHVLEAILSCAVSSFVNNGHVFQTNTVLTPAHLNVKRKGHLCHTGMHPSLQGKCHLDGYARIILTTNQPEHICHLVNNVWGLPLWHTGVQSTVWPPVWPSLHPLYVMMMKHCIVTGTMDPSVSTKEFHNIFSINLGNISVSKT